MHADPRAQEMARYVVRRRLDAGLTGQDWIAEHELGDGDAPGVLTSVARSRVRASRASARSGGCSPAPGGFALSNQRPISRAATIATELVRVTRSVFRAAARDQVNVEFSWGATEVKAAGAGRRDRARRPKPVRRSRANRLRIIDTVMESNTQLIANRAGARRFAGSGRRSRTSRLLLRAAIEAQGRVGIMLNVRRTICTACSALLPALQRPTISPLSDDEWSGGQHDHRRAHGALI